MLQDSVYFVTYWEEPLLSNRHFFLTFFSPLIRLPASLKYLRCTQAESLVLKERGSELLFEVEEVVRGKKNFGREGELW